MVGLVGAIVLEQQRAKRKRLLLAQPLDFDALAEMDKNGDGVDAVIIRDFPFLYFFYIIYINLVYCCSLSIRANSSALF
jgi:hypothetical protein